MIPSWKAFTALSQITKAIKDFAFVRHCAGTSGLAYKSRVISMSPIDWPAIRDAGGYKLDGMDGREVGMPFGKALSLGIGCDGASLQCPQKIAQNTVLPALDVDSSWMICRTP